MTKRILILLSLITGVAFAASTYTTHYNLEKSADGDTNWGNAYRTNMNTIDTTLYSNATDILNHTTDTVGAHAATAISTTAGSTVCDTSFNVQNYLDCLDANFGAIVGGSVMTTNTDQSVSGIKTFSATPIISTFSTGVVHSDSFGALTSSSVVSGDIEDATITNSDINSSASIADTKLATISTAGKVSNSATTAASANTASAIVARDVSGNFTAGTITAALTGNSSTSTALAANPTDCGAGTKATAIDASGNLTCSAASLTADVSGVLPLSNGGTNKNMTAVNGGLIYSDADSQEVTSAGTSQNWVLSGGAGAPTMSNTTTTGKFVDGSADEIQMRVQGHSTQTSNIITVEKSDATVLLNVTNTAGTAIRGTTTNDAAATGFVGEIVTASLVRSSATSLTNATAKTVTSISLTAGDWEVYGGLAFNSGATTSITETGGAFSLTTNAVPSADVVMVPTSNEIRNSTNYAAFVPGSGADVTVTMPTYRVSLSATTTIFLVAKSNFTVSTLAGYGYIQARRLR
jgi:hypothetical protein